MEGTQGVSGAVPKWMDLESLEKLVDTVLDKRAAREAEQKSKTEQNQRIDLRTQVTALRPPADAVGYRLVLPMQGADERPRLSPKSREGRRNWYSLTPFRYPEDARLTDGNGIVCSGSIDKDDISSLTHRQAAESQDCTTLLGLLLALPHKLRRSLHPFR